MKTTLSTAVSEKEWEDVLQVQEFHGSWWTNLGEAGISLQPLERTMPEKISHCNLWEISVKSSWVFPEGAVVREDPMLLPRKCGKEGRKEGMAERSYF